MSIWRRAAINIVSKTVMPLIGEEHRFARSLEFAPREEVDAAIDERLRALLLRAASTVPYYADVLEVSGVVVGGVVRLENFERIPFLTKDIIRNEGANLYASDYKTRHPYENTSGGSTGEPVKFIQDREYELRRYGSRFFYNTWAGKKPGDRELMLWGSERDVLKGSRTALDRLKHWVFASDFLNSYRMGEEEMTRYADHWNAARPVMVWAYVESIYEFARFLRDSGGRVAAPKSIVSSAGTLTEPVREFVEEVMRCPVLNQYGSREVGPVAAECLEQDGLHILENSVYIEILSADGSPAAPGQQGEVVVTSLTNHSMPLIRYKIGDLAVPAGHACSCGRSLKTLQAVTGRTTDRFRTRAGVLVDGRFFNELLIPKPWVKTYQVHQTDYDRITAYVVKLAEPQPGDIEGIQADVRTAMGDDCELRVEFVDDIAPCASGKFRYTICDLEDDAGDMLADRG